VQLLDEVSKSLPDMLWLTDLTQQGTDVTIQGQSTTLIALSDFVGNLGNSPLLVKPVEIVNSQVDSVTVGRAAGGRGAGPSTVDVIKFTVKAQLVAPKTAPPAAAAAGRGRSGRGAAPPTPAARGGR
jgi:type IV pilus assembly protein PilN